MKSGEFRFSFVLTPFPLCYVETKSNLFQRKFKYMIASWLSCFGLHLVFLILIAGYYTLYVVIVIRQCTVVFSNFLITNLFIVRLGLLHILQAVPDNF